MARTFRVAYTPVENSDKELCHYGQPIEDKEFKVADSNGDKTLRQAWQRECQRLNAKYPQLNHWIADEQSDGY